MSRRVSIVNQGSGGGVTGVTATAPLLSSGGLTPEISITPGSNVNDILTWSGSAWVVSPGSATASLTTVNATPATLLTLTPVDASTTTYKVVIAAHKTGAGASYGRVGSFRGGVVATQIGVTASLWTQEDVPALDAYFTVAGSTVQITVVGEAATTWNWTCTVVPQVAL